MGASVTPQTPPNTITFTPGGTVVINGSAIGGNNAVSIQIQNKEICYIDSSGNLNTASGSAFITSIAAPAAASANGLSVSGTALSATPADGTHPGIVTTAAQTFAGVKTFASVPVTAGLTAPAATAQTFTTNVADGATAIGFKFIQGTDLLTKGAKVFDYQDSEGSSLFTCSIRGGQVDPHLADMIATGGAHPCTIGWDNDLNVTGLWLGYGLGSITGQNMSFYSNSDIVWMNAGASGLLVFTTQNGGGPIEMRPGSGGTGLDLTGQTSYKVLYGFTDISGTPGAGTANTASGTGALVGSSGASFKVTCSCVGAGSLILISYAGAPDSTAGALGASYTSGGFNVYSAGVAAGNTKFNWLVIN